MEQKPDEKPVRPQNKNLRPPFRKGEVIPGAGRPPGQKNYATLYKEALIKIATQNNTTPDEIEGKLLSKGLANAIAGDYRFYKDVLDRNFGTAPQVIKQETKSTVDLSVAGHQIAQKFEDELKKNI